MDGEEGYTVGRDDSMVRRGIENTSTSLEPCRIGTEMRMHHAGRSSVSGTGSDILWFLISTGRTDVKTFQ